MLPISFTLPDIDEEADLRFLFFDEAAEDCSAALDVAAWSRTAAMKALILV